MAFQCKIAVAVTIVHGVTITSSPGSMLIAPTGQLIPMSKNLPLCSV